MEQEQKNQESIEPSTLYVVATPIGNLADISARARETLARVDAVLCEDTRHFGTLASALGLNCKLISYHEHNESGKSPGLVEELKNGASFALVSDAGTPTINDPGYRIINLCWENEVKVIPIPGPCAFITALSCSGFETHKFIFQGYLPVKGKKKIDALQEGLDFEATTIFYESPHRILKTLEQLAELEPSREIFLARELTKKFEECSRGPAANIFSALKDRKARGEYVLLLRGQQYSDKNQAPPE